MNFLKKIFSLIVILFLVFLASRAIVRTLPGNPLETILAETGTTLAPAVIQAELGLDRPFIPSLFEDLKKIMHGDWGRSLLTNTPIGPVLADAFKHTFILTTTALLIGLTISLAISVPASLDKFCSLYGSLTAALPTPWLGPILAYIFAVKLPLFPIGGHVALPAFTLALGFSGFWARLIRERLRESLAFGAASGARARGIPEWKVIFKYGLAPVSGALLAYLGTQIGLLLTGAFVTEVIFDWPGIGTLLIDAVLKRDYTTVEAAVFVAATTSLLGTAVGDWTQSKFDPRTKAHEI
jgi:ABC-type dipeptide/oligopeptide/nickel transport system permease component